MKKGLGRIVIIMLLVSLFHTTCFAEETMNVGLSELKIANNVMTLQVSNDIEDTTIPVTYAVSADEMDLPVVSVDTNANQNVGVSYLFLVDVSGSMNDGKMSEMRATLFNIVSGMKANDNACIMLVGNDTYTESFTSDKESLLSSINGLEQNHENTNLYYGINEALTVLSTSENALEKKCLVILSDGEEYQVTGITKEEVENKINEKNITIFTVASLGSNPTSEKEETAKQLGSFARMSPGGSHYLLGVNDVTAEFAAQKIMHDIENGLFIQVDMSGFTSTSSEVYIEVSASAGGYGTATDGYKVNTATIKKGLVQQEETESTEVPEDTQSISDEEDKQESDLALNKMIAIIIAIVSAFVVLLIVILILVKRKKKLLKEQEESKKQKEVKQSDETQDDEKHNDNSQECELPEANSEEQNILEKSDEISVQSLPTIAITLTKVGLIETEEKKLNLKSRLVIGRLAMKSDVTFPDDKKLSSAHCVLEYDGKNVSVTDLGSLNGTFVNGVTIKQKFNLVNDDVISFGENEWRINF